MDGHKQNFHKENIFIKYVEGHEAHHKAKVPKHCSVTIQLEYCLI